MKTARDELDRLEPLCSVTANQRELWRALVVDVEALRSENAALIRRVAELERKMEATRDDWK